jgi:tripartite-type tricarboxylate transporter receptor subunit TctC
MAAAAHLAAELFKAEAKIDIVHVPYKGAAPALQDVIAGHVQMMFATAASVVPHIQSAQVRALAVTTLKRTAVFPELATVDELGLKGFDATTWHGLVTPSRTPKEVVGTLHRATVAALADAAVRKAARRSWRRYRGQHARGIQRLHQAEIPKWTAIVKASGATLIDGRAPTAVMPGRASSNRRRFNWFREAGDYWIAFADDDNGESLQNDSVLR